MAGSGLWLVAALWTLSAAALPPSALPPSALPPSALPPSALPPSALPPSDVPAVSIPGNGSEWSCPHMVDVVSISCMCDVPHTVRCRGEAQQPGDLAQLVATITAGGQVSLLDLAVHGLRELPRQTFQGLELLGLIVTTTDLGSLSPLAFAGLEATLTALGLPGNSLASVPAAALKPLKHLQRLDLSDNAITQLPPRAFPTMLQLQNLNLAGNQLQVVQPEAFVRLPRLSSLDLARNKLDAGQLNNKTLRGLHGLTRLSLQANLLKGEVTPALITGAPGLTSLDLSHNELTSVSLGALASCPGLQDLDLSHNHIDVIHDHAFSRVPQLRRLRLSHNRVVAVSGWSLAHTPHLTHLALADNNLRAVTADLLHQLPALQALDLSANDITLLQPRVFDATPDLHTLSLADNPLHCDCSIAWFVEWVSGRGLAGDGANTAVCATPPSLENAPLIELDKSQLVCSEENHDYFHDYFHDYYHDEATNDDALDTLVSTAEISLQAAHWVSPQRSAEDGQQAGVELIWRVDDRAIPYTCAKVYVYEEVHQGRSSHQVLAESVDVNCTSDGARDPHRVAVMVPGDALLPGATYMYCLMLIERGTGDDEAFLPGCSEPLLLAAAPFNHPQENVVDLPEVTSLTAGGVGGHLIVHTRVDSRLTPCTYTVAVMAGHRVAATRQLNCSEARHEFPTLTYGQYTVCADPDIPGLAHDLSSLEDNLSRAANVTAALHATFSICTPVIHVPPRQQPMGGGPWFTLLFTLPGLALVVTLYVIARRVWRGGGVPWRWDPRAQKSGKYFLYTGEVVTPSLSMDPLPADPPESTTPV